MRHVRFGRTGLVVSELCFGTMTFGGDGFWTAIGRQSQTEADALVRVAFEAGINFFDTADVYSNGLAERMLGQALRNLELPRDQVIVATKVFGRLGAGPNDHGLSRHHILNSVDASLKRLGIDYIDLYQIHGSDPATPLEETMDALDTCVRAGKVRYLGFCNLPAWQAMKANALAERRGGARFDSAQVYYSIAGRDIERELVPFCRSEGLAVLPWSPLAGGLLSGKFDREGHGPDGARRKTFDFPPVDHVRAFDCVDALRPMAEARGCSVARLALAWALRQPGVTAPIIGAKTQAQLLDNLAAVEVCFEPHELDALDRVSALPAEYPGWMLARQGAERRTLVG